MMRREPRKNKIPREKSRPRPRTPSLVGLGLGGVQRQALGLVGAAGVAHRVSASAQLRKRARFARVFFGGPVKRGLGLLVVFKGNQEEHHHFEGSSKHGGFLLPC